MFWFIGVVCGILLGLTGAGGSVFAVPLLLLLTQVNTSEATGLALVAVTISAAIGLMLQWRDNKVMLRPSLILAAFGIATAPLGRWCHHLLPEAALLAAFAVVSMAIAAWMWRASQQTPLVRAYLAGGEVHQPICRFSTNSVQLRPKCLWSLMASGLAIGFLSGLFGVGGGFLIVPLLLWITRAPMINAVASSLMVIALVSSVGVVSHFLLFAPLPTGHVLAMVGGALLGMAISHLVAARIRSNQLQKLFAVALVVMSLAAFFTRLQ